MQYQDIWYKGQDGLQLYARDYRAVGTGADHRPPILCLHGLTRNSADFASLCEHLSNRYRIIAADQRGRGRSDYDSNAANYHPGCYVQDMLVLLDTLELEEVVIIGTSLGGLMAMILASQKPGLLQAVVLNDVGPVVESTGLERIKTYVNNRASANNWQEAVAAIRAVHAPEFPDLNEEDWLRFAHNVYRETDDGSLQLAYDPAISEPIKQSHSAAVPADLWPLFQSLSAMPMLLLRGETSDILSLETVAEMRRRKPDLHYCEVPRCGHAPMLVEPESVSAIDTFLDGLDDRWQHWRTRVGRTPPADPDTRYPDIPRHR